MIINFLLGCSMFNFSTWLHTSAGFKTGLAFFLVKWEHQHLWITNGQFSGAGQKNAMSSSTIFLHGCTLIIKLFWSGSSCLQTKFINYATTTGPILFNILHLKANLQTCVPKQSRNGGWFCSTTAWSAASLGSTLSKVCLFMTSLSFKFENSERRAN